MKITFFKFKRAYVARKLTTLNPSKKRLMPNRPSATMTTQLIGGSKQNKG